jgi:hypothetical protein
MQGSGLNDVCRAVGAGASNTDVRRGDLGRARGIPDRHEQHVAARSGKARIKDRKEATDSIRAAFRRRPSVGRFLMAPLALLAAALSYFVARGATINNERLIRDVHRGSIHEQVATTISTVILRNPILWFFLLAYATSWAFWVPAVFASLGWIAPCRRGTCTSSAVWGR